MRDVRTPESPPPRVLLDAHGRVPAEGPLFDPSLGPTLVCTIAARPEAVDVWVAAGAKVETVAPAADGVGVDLDETFALLGNGREGYCRCSSKAAARSRARCWRGGHARRLVTYVAPVLLGERAPAGYRRPGPDTIADAVPFDLAAVRQLGPDVRLDYDLTAASGLMFTGIVEELGRVRSIIPNGGGARIEIDAKIVVDDARVGDSIAVNGSCLTVVECSPDGWAADAVTETLARTKLGSLQPGDLVNLERPVRLQDRLGGHLVQGHIDGTGTVRGHAEPRRLQHVHVRGAGRAAALGRAQGIDRGRRDQSHRRGPPRRRRRFDVAVIPHTLAVTTLGRTAPAGA